MCSDIPTSSYAYYGNSTDGSYVLLIIAIGKLSCNSDVTTKLVTPPIPSYGAGEVRNIRRGS